jgi:DNA-binding MarR family transcriptional regulator
MADLTKSQEAVLLALREFIPDHGYSPTVAELAKLIGRASPNSTAAALTALEKKGWIKRGRATRNIALIDWSERGKLIAALSKLPIESLRQAAAFAKKLPSKQPRPRAANGPIDTRQMTQADVIRLVELDFAPADRFKALALLDGYNPLNCPAGVINMRVAILRISQGKIEGLIKGIKLAEEDFRDAYIAAYSPTFCKIGFVGMDKLTGEERAEVRNRERRQFDEWFNRE